MSAVEKIARAHLHANLPAFRPGDTVRVHVKIKEGDKTRVQPFEGVVIGRRGRDVQETFTVRKVSFGIGVERIFPLHSPLIESVETLRAGPRAPRQALLPARQEGQEGHPHQGSLRQRRSRSPRRAVIRLHPLACYSERSEESHRCQWHRLRSFGLRPQDDRRGAAMPKVTNSGASPQFVILSGALQPRTESR